MWVKNTSGKPDAMLTFAVISFAVVTTNILLSTLGNFEGQNISFSFQLIETGAMTSYLAATFGAYVTRRWTDKRYKKEDQEEVQGVFHTEA